jgi:hypothetical protein
MSDEREVKEVEESKCLKIRGRKVRFHRSEILEDLKGLFDFLIVTV